jgi:transcriptional regulator with XRE-family HTH domain
MEQRRRSRAKSPLDHEPGAVTWARRGAGLTMTQLAAAAGVSLSLISEIEKGTRNAGPDLIEVMAEVLGCPPDQLKRKGDVPRPRPRPVVVCAECTALWKPGHECALPREANGAAA